MNWSKLKLNWSFVAWSLVGALGLQLLIALIRPINDYLLLAGHSPVVSWLSLQRLLMQHPLVALATIGWVMALSLLAVAGLLIWLTGSRLIFQQQFSLTNLVMVMRRWRFHDWGRAWLAAMATIVAVLPPVSFGFRTPLTVASRLWVMILDYGFRLAWLPVALITFYIVCLYCSLRWFYVLPSLASGQEQTLGNSWQQTRGRLTWRLLAHLGTAWLRWAAISWAINLLILMMQSLWDRWGWQPRWLMAVDLWLAMLLATLCLLGWLQQLIRLADVDMKDKAVTRCSFSRRGAIITVIWLIVAGLGCWQYFPPLQHLPAFISHRGVAEADGVQNTLPAMKKTHRDDHPDYVEIDVHETRDGRFVVMHDENLRKLTGVNKRPRQLSLRQVTQLTAKENGHRARIDSFDHYLAVANAHRQRLLIEIKTTATDSPHIWQHFVRRYARRLQKHGDLIQSMDAGVLQQLNQQAPHLRQIYIQAYNVGGPSRKLAGFNIEYSSVNPFFIQRAHDHHQPVYVWTVNDPSSAREAVYQQADGLVTDRLALVRHAAQDAMKRPNGAKRLWYILNPVPNWGNWRFRN